MWVSKKLLRKDRRVKFEFKFSFLYLSFQSFVSSFTFSGWEFWSRVLFIVWEFELDEKKKKDHHVRFWKMVCASFSFLFFSRSLFFGTQKLCCECEIDQKKRRSAIWESYARKRRKLRASFFLSGSFWYSEVRHTEWHPKGSIIRYFSWYFSWYFSLLGFVISVSFFSPSLVVFFSGSHVVWDRCSSCKSARSRMDRRPRSFLHWIKNRPRRLCMGHFTFHTTADLGCPLTGSIPV